MFPVSVLRDFVVAALPSLAGRDYTNNWYTHGKAPTSKAVTVRIDSASLQWPDHRVATYIIHADNVTITPPEGEEFTFTDVIATGLCIIYLCDMKAPTNTAASWRFLAGEVCGLPTNVKTKNPGMLSLINIFS